jgi:hypothetical protein
MNGETENPIVIGKAACPRPFRHLDRNSLPVIWRSNKKAWMTSAIMEKWILSFNGRMKSQGRKVILFLDNATCHLLLKSTPVPMFLSLLNRLMSLMLLTGSIKPRGKFSPKQ